MKYWFGQELIGFDLVDFVLDQEDLVLTKEILYWTKKFLVQIIVAEIS